MTSEDLNEFISTAEKEPEEQKSETSSVEDAGEIINNDLDEEFVADLHRRRKTYEYISN